MQKSKLLDIIIIVLLGLAIVATAAAGFYFYNENEAFNQKLGDQQKKIDEANLKIKAYKSDNFKLAQIEAEKKRLDTFLPTKENQAEFVIELEKIAEGSALKVISCKMDPSPKLIKSVAGFQAFRWNVAFQGNYKQLLDFLAKLPKSERMVAVAEMKLSSELTLTTRDSYLMEMELGLDLITHAPALPKTPPPPAPVK
jgi:Tfp pilus assembly protein PilO